MQVFILSVFPALKYWKGCGCCCCRYYCVFVIVDKITSCGFQKRDTGESSLSAHSQNSVIRLFSVVSYLFRFLFAVWITILKLRSRTNISICSERVFLAISQLWISSANFRCQLFALVYCFERPFRVLHVLLFWADVLQS